MKRTISCGFPILWLAFVPALGQDVPYGPAETVDESFASDAIVVADLDRDGTPDPIAVSTQAGQVVWWPSPSAGSTWSRRQIDAAFPGASDIGAIDIDRDGDIDLYGASATSGVVAWWESVDLTLDHWVRHEVDAAFAGAVDVRALDVDRDGDVDLAAAGRDAGAIAWWENRLSDGLGWVRRVVITGFAGANTLGFADVDRDGDLDLGGTAASSGDVAWFENALGEGAGWVRHPVGTVEAPVDAELFDYDRDGEIEFVVVGAAATPAKGTSGGQNVWVYSDTEEVLIDLEGDVYLVPQDGNRNGLWEVPGTATTLEYDGSDATRWSGLPEQEPPADLAVTDSYMFYARPSTSVWVSRYSDISTAIDSTYLPRPELGALQSLAARQPALPVPRGASPESKYWDLYRQYRLAQQEGPQWSMAAGESPAQRGISSGGVSWIGRADGWSGEWNAHPVDPSFPARDTATADLDGNGTGDIVAASEALGRIAWWSNDTGNGDAWTPHVLADGVDGAIRVVTGDVDGDGDLDVVVAAFIDGAVIWFENVARDGSVWTQHVVDSSVSGAHEVVLADVDRDGDLDVLGTSFVAGAFSWWENGAGDGSTWVTHAIATGYAGAARVRFADLDGDGDGDVVAVALTAGDVVWFENVDGAGGAWDAHLIDGVVHGAIALDVADSDLDGDLDIAVAAFDADQVLYYDNALGDASHFFKFVVDDSLDGATAVVMDDVDLDGDRDFVAAGTFAEEIRIYTNIGGQYAFRTTGTAPAELAAREVDDLLAVTLGHKGRVGDDDVEWASLALEFTAPDGSPLGADRATLSFARVGLAADDGSGAYEPESDAVIHETTDLIVTDGVLTLELPDGDARLRVDVGPPSRYFVFAELSGSAAARLPDGFRVSHRIVGGSRVEDADFDTVLRPQEDPDTASAVIVPAGCAADDLGLRVRGVDATFVEWSNPGGVGAFDVIRGDLAALGAGPDAVTLGAVVCVENDSTDTTTDSGAEAATPDVALPAAGSAFFYLVRSAAATFGRGADCALERTPASGDCPL